MGKSSRWHSFHEWQRRAGRKKARLKRRERIEKGQSKKQPGWISKVWYIHPVQYHSAEKATSHQATKGRGGPKAHTAEQRKPACRGHQLSRDANYTPSWESTTTQTKPSGAARKRGEQGRMKRWRTGDFQGRKNHCVQQTRVDTRHHTFPKSPGAQLRP